MTSGHSPANQPGNSPRNPSSRTLVLVIAAVVLLALGYMLFRTVTTPGTQGDQTAQPKN